MVQAYLNKMSERYEIATFFDQVCGGGQTPHMHHKVTIDNYGEGKYFVNHIDASYMVKEDKPYTNPLSPCLIRFIQAANDGVKLTNKGFCTGHAEITSGFVKSLYLLQEVQKEMEDEIDRQVIEKVAAFEADYERRIQMFKDDFQAEIDEARKILQTSKNSPLIPTPIIEHYIKSYKYTCRKCNVHPVPTTIKNCSCAYKDCCNICLKGQRHASHCTLFCNGKIWIE